MLWLLNALVAPSCQEIPTAAIRSRSELIQPSIFHHLFWPLNALPGAAIFLPSHHQYLEAALHLTHALVTDKSTPAPASFIKTGGLLWIWDSVSRMPILEGCFIFQSWYRFDATQPRFSDRWIVWNNDRRHVSRIYLKLTRKGRNRCSTNALTWHLICDSHFRTHEEKISSLCVGWPRLQAIIH